MQVVADDPSLLPELAGHAGMEVAPEKVKALAPLPEIDHSGLIRMKRQTQLTQDGSCLPLGLLGLLPRVTQHYEVVRIADDFSGTMLGPGPAQRHAGRYWRAEVRSPRPGESP